MDDPKAQYEPNIVWWDYYQDGNPIPIEIMPMTPEDEEHFFEVMAEFLWKHRHLAKKP